MVLSLHVLWLKARISHEGFMLWLGADVGGLKVILRLAACKGSVLRLVIMYGSVTKLVAFEGLLLRLVAIYTVMRFVANCGISTFYVKLNAGTWCCHNSNTLDKSLFQYISHNTQFSVNKIYDIHVI